MTERGNDDQSDPSSEAETDDEIFAVGGGRRPEPNAPETGDDGALSGWTDDDLDAPPASPYPDDPRNRPLTDSAPSTHPHQTDLPPAARPVTPQGSPSGAASGSPRTYPQGPGSGYAGTPRYPTTPAHPTEQRFGRRAPRRGPQPDAHGYYPSDYYIAPNWMRLVVGGLVGAIIVVAAVGGGFYLFDRFGPEGDDETTAAATPTPLALVPVYQCAGDDQAVTEMMAPTATLIAGRTADSRWLAFRNPSAPPLQLWVRQTSVPDFDPQRVGIVSCASSPNEFPTPASAPRAPIATPTPLASSDQG